MKENLVGFFVAKLAKEKGCNLENCTCGGYPDCICYDKRISQSLLAKWLREEHNIHVTSKYDIVLEKGYGYTLYFFMKDRDSFVNKELISYIYKTYEEAYEIGLYQALLLL